MNFLHLTHTDIKTDSRILKEIEAVKNSFPLHNVYGLGVETYPTSPKSIENVEITSIKCLVKKVRFVPALFIHTSFVLELVVRLFTKALKIKPDIIHCHDIVTLPLGVLVKLFTGASLIYDAHELESRKNGLSPLLGKLSEIVEKIFWPFIDLLIVVSPSIQKWYLENIGYKNSQIILNSPKINVKSNNFKSESYLRKKFGIPKDQKIFLYVGAFAHGRAIEKLLNVFKSDEVNSCIVFLGDGILKPELLSESKQNPKIFVHPMVEHDDVVNIAKSADVGLCLIENVSLSDYYSLPNKLFEYSFAELFILASNFPDIQKIVNDYQIGYCCELTTMAIKEAVNKVEDLDKISIENVESLYELSWEIQEEKIKNLYENVVKLRQAT